MIFDAVRRHNSKAAVPRNPIQESVSPNTFSSRSISSGSRISQPIFRNLIFQNALKDNRRNSPFVDGAKRFYYVDSKKVQHFKPRGYKKWIQNPKNAFVVVLVGSGIVITVYFGNMETVPYTKRSHFVLLSSSLEKELGETQFKSLKAQYKGKILPPLHPESIRVQKIAQEVVEAVQKGLRKEQVWTDIGYSSESAMLPQEAHEEESLRAFSHKNDEDEQWIGEDKWHKEDEILNDKWVQQSRKKGQEMGVKSKTSHLEGFKWEVIVVNEPIVNAFCLPGGKIVVFTGLLKHFRADAEVATIIGHEVCVACVEFLHICVG